MVEMRQSSASSCRIVMLRDNLVIDHLDTEPWGPRRLGAIWIDRVSAPLDAGIICRIYANTYAYTNLDTKGWRVGKRP